VRPGPIFEIVITKGSGKSNFIDIGGVVRRIISMNSLNVFHNGPEILERSWEMSFIMALHGEKGVYSGTVESISNGNIIFGPVKHTEVKERKASNLITYKDIKGIRLSPQFMY